jgi:GxxExxY protein
MQISQQYLNDLTYKITSCAIEVNKQIGPGLLESIYEKCFVHELTMRGISHISQQPVSVKYKSVTLDTDLRLDVLVEDLIIVELKSVDELLPVHEAQVLTYMKLLGKPKGILFNFNCINIINEGRKTLVNEEYKKLPKY